MADRLQRSFLRATPLFLSALLVWHSTACSLFGSRYQDLRVTSSPPGAAVVIDGEQRGTTPTKIRLRRNQDLTLEVKKEGYKTEFRHLNADNPSTVGILDLVGGWFLILPFFGLLSDAAWDYDPASYGVHLDPLGDSQLPPNVPMVGGLPSFSSKALTAAPGTRLGSYRALVIGNDEYSHLPALRTARNDAAAIAALLSESYGFEVELLTDATRREIVNKLSSLRGGLGTDSNLLVYYAGHGWYDERAQRGYWLPVDATMDDPSNWLSNATVTDAVLANPAKHVLVMADSCYSGTLTRGIRPQNPDLHYMQRLANLRSRTALTSGGLEPVEDGLGSGHSAFAAAILSALQDNTAVMAGHELFTAIRREVMLNSDQVPQYSDIRRAGHEGGDFLFIRLRQAPGDGREAIEETPRPNDRHGRE